LIDQSLTEGANLLSLGGNESTALLTNAMKQKQDLAQAIGEIAKQMGLVLNQPQRGTPDTAQSIASGAQSWGAGDYDPYAGLITSDMGT
jgi:hypothetical protein